MSAATVLGPPFHGATDVDLVAAVRGGAPAAEEALFHRHAPRVHRLVWRFARDPELAHELTHEVFIRVFETLAGFRGEAAFTTWLHRVTVTTTLNALRQRKRRHRGEVALVEARDVAVHGDVDPLLRSALETAIAALPDPLRLPLVMHALEGWSHQEIAEVLGLTEGTSRRRVFEARAALRRALDPATGDAT